MKNVFILIPAFFAGKIGLLFEDWKLVLAFFSFCCLASGIYIINDVLDAERDRLHEKKRERPVAAGKVSVSKALFFAFALIVIAIATGFYIGLQYFLVLIGYLLLNLAYSFYLKNISLVDISCIALGFILRVVAGGYVAQVPISKWLILMTFLLACCLSLGKRRDDLLLDVDKGTLRQSLKGYNLVFIDTCLMILGATTIVCYIMYAVSEEVVHRLHSDHVYLTSLFVIMGVLRFMQIVLVDQQSGSPTLILLKDRMIQLMITLWLLSFFVMLYVY